MAKKLRIDPNILKPTNFYSQTQKAQWADALLAFVESGFDQKEFTDKVYKRLSMCFLHIAHFDRGGFWEEWFSNPSRQYAWMKHVLASPSFGDSAYTFCDVEREIRSYLVARPELIEAIMDKANQFERGNDEDEFNRLKTKLGK